MSDSYIEQIGAQVNTKVEEGRVCLTVTYEGKLVSQMRLTVEQADNIAMRLMLSARQRIGGTMTGVYLQRHSSGECAYLHVKDKAVYITPADAKEICVQLMEWLNDEPREAQ